MAPPFLLLDVEDKLIALVQSYQFDFFGSLLFNNLEKLIQKVLNTVTSVLELLGENKIVVNLVLGCMTA